MTRDEAIDLRLKFTGDFTKLAIPPAQLREIISNEIDFCVASGMLKLDEPLVPRSSPLYKLYEALFEHVPTLDFLPFKQLIEKSGLKIVEK